MTVAILDARGVRKYLLRNMVRPFAGPISPSEKRMEH
jgi:hypothetical protein